MKLYIWGTGRLAGKVVGRYIYLKQIQAFVDNDKNKRGYMGKPVITPEELAKLEYDAVLVANLFCKEIYAQCQKLGIELRKVIFLYGNCTIKDVNRDYDFIEEILGKEYAEIIRKRYHIVRGVEAYGDLCLKDAHWLRGGGIPKLTMCV